MRIHSRLLFFLLLFLVVGIPGIGAGEDNTEISGDAAPFSLNYQQSVIDQSAQEKSDVCCGSGPLRASPLDLSHLIGKHVSGLRALTYYPSSFDLRKSGRVPPIRDQGQSGSCWDFAAIKSLESSLLPSEAKDFSENNLKNRVSVYDPEGFDFSDGGNDLMAAAYFLRGSGPVPERLDPYNPYSYRSPENLPVEARIGDVPMIPGRSGPTDNENIKWALIEYGALYTTILYDDQYYSPTKSAFYNPDGRTPNHAISIIGWDDNYPASSFRKTPPGDGAFLCANSWGTSWGDEGFFYVSYYDTLIGRQISAFSAEKTKTDGKYGYDTLGWVNSYGFGFPDASAANVFIAEADIEIVNAGFYIPQVGTSATASIWLDPQNGPENGVGPAVSASDSFQIPGYQTLRFDKPVRIKKGQSFSVIVDFYTPDYGFPIPVEYPVPGYSSKAKASPGQSYIKASKGSWSDLTNWDPQANVCIRAGFVLVSGPKADFYGEPTAGSAPLTVSFHDVSTGGPTRWLWQFGDGATSTEQNPVHTYYHDGSYSVSLTCDTPSGESRTVKDGYIRVSKPVSIVVPDDHSLIQEAINTASPGSTILVRYGYYPEKLTINKPIQLLGETAADEQKPIIDAQFTGTPVSITSTGVTVSNFTLTGAWSETAIRPAVAIRGNNAIVRDNWIFENYAGIRCEGVDGAKIEGNIIWNSTSSAIFSESSSYQSFINNTIIWTRKAQAIRMVSGYNSVIRGNAIAENDMSGLSLSGTGITVYDNYLNNTVNVDLTPDTKVTWNVPKTAGPNIVLGPYIGGNFWAAPDGYGFSETHPDEDGDGFCDLPYRLGGENVDELPLAVPTSVPPRADFTAAPLSGELPLMVQFTDRSLGLVESWDWNFGDGTNSNERHPTHTYQAAGTYDVSLTVTGPKGTDKKTRPRYITVTGSGTSFSLSLMPGWNFITPPKTLSDGSNTAAVFEHIDTAGHSIFTFPNLTTGWEKVERYTALQPVQGYWIYSTKRTEIPLWLNPVSGGKRSVSAGWNAIGTPGAGPVMARDAMKDLGDRWVYLIAYEGATQRYDDMIIRGGTGVNADTRLCKAGSGYWLYMTAPGDIYYN